jgi:hypothetical protein
VADDVGLALTQCLGIANVDEQLHARQIDDATEAVGLTLTPLLTLEDFK